jgi:WD40 repeat protein
MRGLSLRKFFIAVYIMAFFLSAFMIEMHSLASRSAMQKPVPILQSGHRVDVVALRPDGQLAVTGGGDGFLKLWDRKTGLLMRTIVAHSGPMTTLNFSRGGDRLVSGGDDGVIKVWHMPSGRQISNFQATKGVITEAVFNGAATLIAVCFNSRDY